MDVDHLRVHICSSQGGLNQPGKVYGMKGGYERVIARWLHGGFIVICTMHSVGENMIKYCARDTPTQLIESILQEGARQCVGEIVYDISDSAICLIGDSVGQ